MVSTFGHQLRVQFGHSTIDPVHSSHKTKKFKTYLPEPAGLSGVFGGSDGLEVDKLSGVPEGNRKSLLAITDGEGVSVMTSMSSSDCGSDLISVDFSDLSRCRIFK